MARPRLEIEYCTKCRFQLRAAWFAQELLTTFDQELAEVALIPGAAGIFEVRVDGDTIASNGWDNKMPDIAEVKRLVRDRVAPDRQIGHR